MRASEALKKHRDVVMRTLAHYPLENPRVFGSTARGEDVEGSDLDLLVDRGGLTSYSHIFELEDAIERNPRCQSGRPYAIRVRASLQRQTRERFEEFKTPKPGRSKRVLLENLVLWGDHVRWILAHTSATEIADHMMTYLALARGVEVVGDIATELMRLHPEWAEPRRSQGLLGANLMRNRLAHAYDDIDAVLLFGIASDDVTRLTGMARLWLAELSEP